MARRLFLPDQARNMGIHVVAGKGAGKSRLLARIIAWLDFVRGIPLVIFDPNGPLVDNFLDKLTRLPPTLQRRVFPRIRYVDTAGTGGRVVPFPLYYRAGDESLYAVAQRYLDVVRRLDPGLQKAPILGWNPLWRLGTNVGMILAAGGLQITEAEDLLRDPKPWERAMAEAVRAFPEVGPALSFLDQMQDLRRRSPQEYSRQVDSYFNKLAMFRLDPTMRAMFGAASAGVDWGRVVERGEAVLIDFRHEVDADRLRFKLLWLFTNLMEFIKRRGPGRHKPLSVVVDEVTYLLPTAGAENELLTADLEELVNRIARNHMVWLTMAHQEMYQLSESVQKALMTMGTQIIGSTSDTQSALSLARRFYRYDPYLVKKREPIYHSCVVIDYRSVEFNKDEQQYAASLRFLDLPRFHFLVGASPTEGTMPTRLVPVSIERIDSGQYVNEELVARLRTLLMQSGGRPVGEVLAEIAARSQPEPLRITRLAPAEPPSTVARPRPAPARERETARSQASA